MKSQPHRVGLLRKLLRDVDFICRVLPLDAMPRLGSKAGEMKQPRVIVCGSVIVFDNRRHGDCYAAGRTRAVSAG